MDTGYKRFFLASTNADGVALGRNTETSNINIAIAGSETLPRNLAHRDVVETGGIVSKCVNTDRRVSAACSIPEERGSPAGRVGAAGCLKHKRRDTDSRVGVSGRVVVQRKATDSRVAVAA